MNGRPQSRTPLCLLMLRFVCMREVQEDKGTDIGPHREIPVSRESIDWADSQLEWAVGHKEQCK